VTGRRKGGKGSKRSREYWEERRREHAARVLLFSLFFRPPDERKNPDRSDFMNYPFRRSDWSLTCHSKARALLVSSDSFIQHGGQVK